MDRHRRAARAWAAAVGLLLLTSCTASPAPARITAARKATVAASVTYTSSSFAVPFSLSVPSWLGTLPTIDSSNFVTWESKDGHRKLRVLAPVSVYKPGAPIDSPVPTDYLPYLLGQAAHGARFVDRVDTRIGSASTTIVTATTKTSLDGSVGCQEHGLDAGTCFGLQPDVVLRIASLHTRGRTLLVWMRYDVGASGLPPIATSFASVLAGFRLRPGVTPVAPSDTRPPTSPIDGTWTNRISEKELTSAPLLDSEELNDDNWGSQVLQFDHGSLIASITNARSTTTPHDRFTVKGDVLTIVADDGTHFVMRWRIDGKRLILTRDKALGVGPTPYVLKPLTKSG